jgi:hypothetical protein
MTLLVRALAFVLLFALLQLGWQSLRGTSLEHLVIHDGTVQPAAHLINLLTPAVHVQAVDFSLRAPGGGLTALARAHDSLLTAAPEVGRRRSAHPVSAPASAESSPP